jgi:F subunit of K+-transporting ATPase (Potass_KdpF)
VTAVILATADNAIGLVLAVLVIAYLVLVLVFPERF